MLDFARMTTADLRECDRLTSALAGHLIARLERRHRPKTMARFFPEEIAPVPNAGYAKKFGKQTLDDVMSAAEYTIIAATARAEIEARKYPNTQTSCP